MPELPPTYARTRSDLHRVAAHVLGRRRHQAAGRFGLRVSPGGFATPAFGTGSEVARISGGSLVHEAGGHTTVAALAGASLRSLATVVGADIDAPFAIGHETPASGDVDAPLDVDAVSADVLASWLQLGARALDQACAAAAEATVAQLWPEHFDVALDVAVGGERRANLGCSPGDGWSAEPYLYVGPWGAERPGADGFWDAPFGATLRWADVLAGSDPLDRAATFLTEGIRRLRSAPTVDEATVDQPAG